MGCFPDKVKDREYSWRLAIEIHSEEAYFGNKFKTADIEDSLIEEYQSFSFELRALNYYINLILTLNINFNLIWF